MESSAMVTVVPTSCTVPAGLLKESLPTSLSPQTTPDSAITNDALTATETVLFSHEELSARSCEVVAVQRKAPNEAGTDEPAALGRPHARPDNSSASSFTLGSDEEEEEDAAWGERRLASHRLTGKAPCGGPHAAKGQNHLSRFSTTFSTTNSTHNHFSSFSNSAYSPAKAHANSGAGGGQKKAAHARFFVEGDIDESDEGENNLMGNGCGEAVSPLSSSSFACAGATATARGGADLTLIVRSNAIAAAAAAKDRHVPSVSVTATAKSSRTFSLEKFAPFFEIAIAEIVADCEKRVASSSDVGKSAQQNFLRGVNNHDLEVSAHSFDTPVSMRKPSFDCLSALDCPSTTGAASANTNLNCNSSNLFFGDAPGSPGGDETPESVAHLLYAFNGILLAEEGASAPMILIAALAYLSKVAVRCTSHHGSVTATNWYRLTTAAILTASKMYNEYTSTRLNRHIAAASKLPLAVVNKLELDFLYLMDFSLVLEEKDVTMWLRWMDRLAAQHGMESIFQNMTLHEVGYDSSTVPMPPPMGLCTQSSSHLLGTESLCSPSYVTGGSFPRNASLFFADDERTSRTGAASSVLSSLRQRALPSPVSEMMVPVTAGGKLFSSVHGAREPRTPPTIRELIRQPTPTSSPTPPSAGKESPSFFFRSHVTQQRTRGRDARSHPTTAGAAAAAATAAHPPRGSCPMGSPSAKVGSPRTATRGGGGGEKRLPASSAAMKQAAPGAKSVWGTMSMLQQVKEVFGVTASLVRGTLQVMQSNTHTHQLAHSSADEADNEAEGELVYDRMLATYGGSKTRRNPAAAPGEPEAARSTTAPPAASSATSRFNIVAQRDMDKQPSASFYLEEEDEHDGSGGAAAAGGPSPGAQQQQHGDDEEWEAGEEDEEGYYDEYGNYYYYDEEDIGYYDPVGAFHYYEKYSEEDEYEGEEEEEQKVFKPPPRTHSPPIL